MFFWQRRKMHLKRKETWEKTLRTKVERKNFNSLSVLLTFWTGEIGTDPPNMGNRGMGEKNLNFCLRDTPRQEEEAAAAASMVAPPFLLLLLRPKMKTVSKKVSPHGQETRKEKDNTFFLLWQPEVYLSIFAKEGHTRKILDIETEQSTTHCGLTRMGEDGNLGLPLALALIV